MGKSKSHARAESETQITISLPKWLKQELTDLAIADDRSRSKWVVRELAEIVQQKRAGKITPFHGHAARAADEPGKYKGERKDKAR